MRIANAHTIFNVANTLIFIWFTGQIARLVEWLVPDRPLEEEGMIIQAKYLDDELLVVDCDLDRCAALLRDGALARAAGTVCAPLA